MGTVWAPTAGTEHITALKKVQVQQISCGYDHCIAFVAEDAGLGVPPVLCVHFVPCKVLDAAYTELAPSRGVPSH